ncbi:MAG: ABC transporter permease [Acidimicrobiia bacterium]
MLQYAVAGLVLGGIYAIAAAGLVITYVSSGILNFAFGSIAYFVARFYYFLHVQQQWAIVPSAVLSTLVAGPLLGVTLYGVLFRHLRLMPQLVKVVAGIGVWVLIPPICDIAFGNTVIIQAPGLAPEPVRVFRVLDVPVDMNQVIVYASVLATMLIGFLVLRFTDVGLKVRALVDSEAMTALSGVSPSRVSMGVWAASSFFAGLCGVLAAPKIGLGLGEFTALVAAAFAAVIAARFRSLPVAIGVGLAMGIAGALVQKYMDVSSSLTAAVIPSIPFAFTVLYLVYHGLRGGRFTDVDRVGGALDRAIRPASANAAVASGSISHRRSMRWLALFPIAFVLALPMLLHGFWIGLVAQAAGYAIVFCSYTLVTGEGGMIWLCQATFAGVGALGTAQLASRHHWPVLLAVAGAAVIAAAMGAGVALLTLRLGNLYVALVTLTFGLLMERLVFTRPVFYKFGLGVALHRPSFARTDRPLAYLVLGVFIVVALFIANLRRSTPGLALASVRWSEPAARTIGIGIVPMKLIVSALGAFAAGLGGGLLAVCYKQALPDGYRTFGGLIWLALIVAVGLRSSVAALTGGMVIAFVPSLLNRYPGPWALSLTALYGFGAAFVAKNPDGIVGWIGRRARAALTALGALLRPRRPGMHLRHTK